MERTILRYPDGLPACRIDDPDSLPDIITVTIQIHKDKLLRDTQDCFVYEVTPHSTTNRISRDKAEVVNLALECISKKVYRRIIDYYKNKEKRELVRNLGLNIEE